MVQVTVGGGGELEGSEADVVESFVIQNHDLISILDQLVDGKGGVVGLDNGVGNLRGGENREGKHHSVGVFLTDLGDQQGSHTGSGTSTHGMSDLESLKHIARLSLLSDNVQNRVNQFSSLGVMSLSPVITSSGLSEDEVIGAEQLSERSSADGVHGSWLQIHKDGTGNVASTSGFVVVYVDSLQLKIGISVVGTGGVYTVFITVICKRKERRDTKVWYS